MNLSISSLLRSKSRAFGKVRNCHKVLSKQMGQVVVHSTVSALHLLVTLCQTHLEQFTLAALLLEGLDRRVTLSGVFLCGCKWPATCCPSFSSSEPQSTCSQLGSAEWELAEKCETTVCSRKLRTSLTVAEAAEHLVCRTAETVGKALPERGESPS